MTEPGADTLELCFDATGREGAARLAPRGRRPPKAVKRLQHLSISPCAATELKARRPSFSSSSWYAHMDAASKVLDKSRDSVVGRGSVHRHESSRHVRAQESTKG